MKKIVLLVITSLVLSIVSIPCFAEQEREILESEDWKYYLNDEGTVTIFSWEGEEEVLWVPCELGGITVTAIGNNAFSNCYWVKEITLPESITAIGDFAFWRCRSLKELVISANVDTVGLNPVVLCDGLKSIKVSPNNDYYADIDGVLFGKKDKSLIAYPSGLDYGKYSIPEGIEIIKQCALNFNSLRSLEIPKTVQIIENGSICGDENLKEIILSPQNNSFEVVDNVLFDKKNNVLICYPAGLEADHYSIPEGTSSIGSGAFVGCELTNVDIPESISVIGNNAFEHCIKLSHIDIPSTVKSIEYLAFYLCEELRAVTIPASVTEIDEEAFRGCENVELIVERDSYAAIYAEENDIPYTYTDSNDWLND